MFETVKDLSEALNQRLFLVGQNVTTAVFLSLRLEKPLLVEGPAGVGKTELGKVLAHATGRKLIRLQCYEGLDEARALYEWNYQMQLLKIQSDHAGNWPETKKGIYSQEFLLPRPLLQALTSEQPVLLLIDEIDKSDEEFESFLLEALSDFQVSIPELGTIKCAHRPVILVTSNSTRELSDALKRRCLFLYMDYPDFDRELEILRLKVPGISAGLARQAVAFVQSIRRYDLKKSPSIAETIDWAQSLSALNKDCLDAETVRDSLAALLKYHQDLVRVADKLPVLIR